MSTWKSSEHPIRFNWRWCVCFKTKHKKAVSQVNLTTEKRAYNYRHSRGRRILENLFSIPQSKWRRLYHKVMNFQPKAMENLILATLTSHNTFTTSSVWDIYCPAGLADTGDVNWELTHDHWGNDICVYSMLS